MSNITLEADEKIIKVVRRHYIVMLPTIFFSCLAALAPLILSKLFGINFISLNPEIESVIGQFFAEWGVFAYAIWLLAIWVMFFIEWTDYYLDLWIITDKKIIDVEQKGFFNREVTSFIYAHIQDITVETKGFIETFFKFGTLHIQTAGHNREILIKDAHYPEDARSLILRLQEQSRSI